MPNGTDADIPTVSSGQTIASSWGNLVGTTVEAIDADVNDAFYDDWAPYTPQWLGTSTNPSLGDGTLDGRYKQIGHTIHFALRLDIGSTTTFGTGLWTFTIPVPAAQDLSSKHMLGLWGSSDTSEGDFYGGAAELYSSAVYCAIYTSPLTYVDADSPIVWADGDSLLISGTYQAASL